MHTFVRPYTAGVAAASAGILTLGLVTAPPNTDVTVAGAEAHVVQLATITEADIRTAIVNTAASVLTPTSTPSPAAATTAQASAPTVAATAQADASAVSPEQIPQILTTVGFVALALAFTPIWYVAFPITLPLSMIVASVFLDALNWSSDPDPVSIAILGLGFWAVWLPLVALNTLYSSLNPPYASPAAVVGSTSSSTADPSVSPQVNQAIASATSKATHPARKHGNEVIGDEAVGNDAVGNEAVGNDAVGNEAVGPLTQASEMAPKPVADQAAAAKPMRTAAEVGDTTALPAQAVTKSKPDKEAATDAAAAHSTGSNKNAKAVSTDKPAKKPAAHSPAAKATGNNNSGHKTKSDH